jgi:hypothetical protein
MYHEKNESGCPFRAHAGFAYNSKLQHQKGLPGPYKTQITEWYLDLT